MDLKQVLNNSKIGLLDKVNFVKTQIKPSEYHKTFNNNRILKQVLNKNQFPDKLENIKVNEPFQFTNDFISEFLWITNKILANSDKINQFITLKEVFEVSILKHEFENARKTIESITSNLGHSLWSIESELHIIEEEKGSNENWQKLSDYLKIIQNPFYEFCMNASSKKIENGLSFESYVNQVQNDINTINANDLVKDFFVFNNFKLASYNYDFSDLRSVLYISNLFSLIDQYNTLIDVIIFNLNSKECQNSNLFRDFVLRLLEGGNLDNRVSNIYNYLSQDKFIENKNLHPINTILESYYGGDFETSLKLSKQFILDYPLEFEIYEIYAKSLINLKKEFEEIGLKSIDSISFALFNFLQFRKDTEKHVKKLIKYALKYSNSILGFQIMDFLSLVDNNKTDSIKYSLYSNLYKISILKHDNIFSHDLEQFFSKTNFYQYKKISSGIKNVDCTNYTTKDELLKFNSEVTFYYHNNDFNSVIELINNQSQFCLSINYYKEWFIFLLFNSYLKENRTEEALNLFGNILFDKETFYLKINFKELFALTFKDDDRFKHVQNVHSLILASIYYSEYNLYEVLDEYICSRDINIKEVLQIKDLKQELFVYLLHKICTIDTIKYYFKRINDAERFRLEILSTLLSIDNPNKKQYNDEIDEINKRISVRNVIKEVNNGRLFVDIDKLKEQLIEKYNDDFNRLIRIVGERKNNNLVGFNASKPRIWEASLKEQLSEEHNNFNDADFIAFKNIYYDVREQFLFSKEHGLDSSLSTRIRHGALENQIRSVFDKLNLVTTKLSGEYIDSEYWNSQNIELENLLVVQEQIKIFSKSIDEFTSGIKNNAIQISHEKISNPYALFNYSVNDEVLFNIYSPLSEYLKDPEDIVEVLLDVFSQHTNNEILSQIYSYFNNVVYDVINQFAQNFIENLPEELSKKTLIVEKISESLTNLQISLEEISGWFSLETSLSNKFVLLDDIIEASIVTTKQMNRNIDIQTTIKNDFKKVEYHISMIYVFNILITNAIVHSENENELKINIIVESFDENTLKINFSNNHRIKSVEEKKNSLTLIKQNWKDSKNIEKVNIEGKSGFPKIKRILIYEANCMTDNFDFEITKDTITIGLYLAKNKIGEKYETIDN